MQTAAAAVYIAARLAQMPLTAVDVASAIRISAKAFGRAYQSAVSALGISVPTTPPDVFLHFGAQKLCKDSDAQVCDCKADISGLVLTAMRLVDSLVYPRRHSKVCLPFAGTLLCLALRQRWSGTRWHLRHGFAPSRITVALPSWSALLRSPSHLKLARWHPAIHAR